MALGNVLGFVRDETRLRRGEALNTAISNLTYSRAPAKMARSGGKVPSRPHPGSSRYT